jgi:hypothetical protein
MKRKPVVLAIATAIASTLSLTAQTFEQEAPIVITAVPSAGQGGSDKMEMIAGKITVKCEGCRVILFAKGGDLWYVQPLADAVYTTIRDGKWSNETHLGTQYAALLAIADYVPPSKTSVLPKEGDGIVAVTIVAGRK